MSTEPSRPGRLRVAAAGALLMVLAGGWVATSRMGQGRVGRGRVGRDHLDGVAVEYRRIAPVALNAAYVEAVGPAPSRSWSRPARPRRVVGRFVRRMEHGRAAMWWTVADRGLLAHAVASDGDPAALFAWWLSHSER